MHNRYYVVYENNKPVKIVGIEPTEGIFKETRYSYKDRSNIHSYMLTLLVDKEDKAKCYIVKSSERVSIATITEHFDSYYKYHIRAKFPEDKFFVTKMLVLVKRWLDENGLGHINKLDWDFYNSELT